MAAGRQLKLPRAFYKKRVPPPAFRPPSKVFTARLHADFNGIGPGRNKAISTIRKVLLQDLATAIVNDLRASHINITMGYEPTVKGWKQYRAEGFLDEDVAILVDGSPQRPIKNVKFAGSIQIVSPASLETIIEAANFAWTWMIAAAAKTQGPWSNGGNRPSKKTNSYRYKKSFEMFVSDKIQVAGPADLRKPNAIDDQDWITIHNYVPYAAKLERYRYPLGVFWVVFKKLRQKYGRQLALRFDFVESTSSVVKTDKGGTTPNAQPVIRIGQPGAFPSSKPNMRKNIRKRPTHSGQRK